MKLLELRRGGHTSYNSSTNVMSSYWFTVHLWFVSFEVYRNRKCKPEPTGRFMRSPDGSKLKVIWKNNVPVKVEGGNSNE